MIDSAKIKQFFADISTNFHFGADASWMAIGDVSNLYVVFDMIAVTDHIRVMAVKHDDIDLKVCNFIFHYDDITVKPLVMDPSGRCIIVINQTNRIRTTDIKEAVQEASRDGSMLKLTIGEESYFVDFISSDGEFTLANSDTGRFVKKNLDPRIAWNQDKHNKHHYTMEGD